MTSRSMIRRLRRTGLPVVLALWAAPALAADPVSPGRGGQAGPAPFTFACIGPGACRPQAGPGPADRQVHPFAGTLGRPCAWRWRETPSGTRKVRVCF